MHHQLDCHAGRGRYVVVGSALVATGVDPSRRLDGQLPSGLILDLLPHLIHLPLALRKTERGVIERKTGGQHAYLRTPPPPPVQDQYRYSRGSGERERERKRVKQRKKRALNTG
jgi:hypothetical protein